MLWTTQSPIAYLITNKAQPLLNKANQRQIQDIDQYLKTYLGNPYNSTEAKRRQAIHICCWGKHQTAPKELMTFTYIGNMRQHPKKLKLFTWTGMENFKS